MKHFHALRGVRASIASAVCRMAIISTLAIPSVAFAQDVGDETDKTASREGVGDIIVTAQFREQNLQDTPIAITALNAEMLENRGITNILGVAQAAPNVNMTEGGGQFGKSNFAYIRGIGSADFSYGFEPRVGFYIDDVYFATVFGSVLDLLDVDRVEVLRGPQGTLFGRNSVGGAMRIFSKKPDDDLGGSASVTVGDYNRFDLKGSINLPIGDGLGAVRIGASRQKRDGHVKQLNFACANPNLAGLLPKGGGADCVVGTLGDTDVVSLRGALRLTPSASIENNVTIDYSDDKGRGSPSVVTGVSLINNGFTAGPNTPSGLGLAGPAIYLPSYGIDVTDPAFSAAILAAGPYANYAIYNNPGLGGDRGALQDGPFAVFDNSPVSAVKSWGISNVFDADLATNLHLKSITAWREYTGQFGTNAQHLPVPLNLSLNNVEHRQFTQELQLTGKAFDSLLDWTIGAFYLQTKSRNFGRLQTESSSQVVRGAARLSQSDRQFEDVARLTSKAAFAHAELHLTDRLNVVAGIRYTYETKNYYYFRDERIYSGNPAGALLDKQSPDVNESRINPRISVDYQIAPRSIVYASYSTGFTSGGFNPRPFAPSDTDIAFAPEDVTSYEIGLKTELLDNRVRLNLAAFRTDWNDLQLMISGCPVGCPTTSPFYYGNAGDVRIKGGEVELEARLVPEWLLTASLGYTDFQYLRIDPQANSRNDPNGLTLSSPAQRSPEWKFSAGTQYEIPLGAAGTLTPRVDMVTQSRTYFSSTTNNPYTQQAPYSIFNARVTYRPPSEKWSLAVFVTNLTDKLYFTGKTDQRDTFGGAYGEVARPRQFGATLAATF